jgi:hypothetical protein
MNVTAAVRKTDLVALADHLKAGCLAHAARAVALTVELGT